MKATGMDTRGRQMLELLAEGASARVVARKLGYSEGTTRVYLHNLYKAIGVRNKTEAVIWYLNRTRAQEQRAATLPTPRATPPAADIDGLAGMSLGDMALNEDLYTAIGIMGSFLGPYGHVWEAGLKLKGEAVDERLVARRAQSRLLWRALLKGDFAYAKLLHDEGIGERFLQDSPSDAWLLACLLQLGGYSSASERLVGPLMLKRKGAPAITAREAALLRTLGEALEGRESGIGALHEIAAEGGRNPIVKQVAMASLFHVHRFRRDADRARATAKAIWAEAESARQQLEAMGVRPLAREHALPRPAKSGAREAPQSRERAAVTR
jgi:DNA-binding CsgD family transcriptional regulator